MSNYEYESPFDTVEDRYDRWRRDEEAAFDDEWYDRRRDRLEEHRPLAKPDARLAWRNAVMDRDQGCVVHRNPADCIPPFQAHHVVTQHHLRKHGHGDALWDPRVGVCVCEGAHVRHTKAVERIPVECLPGEVVAFVRELGLGWTLDRYYSRRAA